MHIISVQSLAGGTGVSLTAAELALRAASQGQKVLAVDTCPQKALTRDLALADFHVIEDVRALFAPLDGARWGRGSMARHALLTYPFASPSYLTDEGHGRLNLGFETMPERMPDAAFHLVQAIADLASRFDAMIVDVSNKCTALMEMFHDVSDEVHLMLRTVPDGAATADQWRARIGRPETAAGGPRIATYPDRGNSECTLDRSGRSSLLADLYAAI